MRYRSRHGSGIGTEMLEVSVQLSRTDARLDDAVVFRMVLAAHVPTRISSWRDSGERSSCEITRRDRWPADRFAIVPDQLLTVGESRSICRSGLSSETVPPARDESRSPGSSRAGSGIPLPVRTGVNDLRSAVTPFIRNRRTWLRTERPRPVVRTTRREATQ